VSGFRETPYAKILVYSHLTSIGWVEQSRKCTKDGYQVSQDPVYSCIQGIDSTLV